MWQNWRNMPNWPNYCHCRTALIWQIGKEVRQGNWCKNVVRTDMWRFDPIYIVFKLPNNYLKSNNAMDVYNRVNYYYLSDATTQYTTKEDDKIKLRLKLALTYIKFAALILKYIILTQNVMPGASSVENT